MVTYVRPKYYLNVPVYFSKGPYSALTMDNGVIFYYYSN